MNRTVVVFGSILFAVAGSFFLGRCTAPEPERVEVSTKTETKEASKETAASAQVSATHATKKQIVRRSKETRPDGTVLERETIRTGVEKSARDMAIAAAERQAERTTKEEHKEVKAAAPKWIFGLHLLVDPLAFRLSDPKAAMLLSGSVSRVLAGPLSVGVSATVPVSNPISLPTLGLSLTLSR